MNKIKIKNKSFCFISLSVSLCLCGLFFSACSQLERPKPEPFYAETAPPQKKEFRWSNGKLPKSFDPALAAAAPETDVVRAVFEGLTDTDSKTLKTIPAIATDWKASDDFKTWTFNLRRDAKWSNGERVTAKDFVRSWKRLAQMGERAAHPELLRNIVGLKISEKGNMPVEPSGELDVLAQPAATESFPILQNQSNTNAGVVPATSEPNTERKTKAEEKAEPEFGVEAVDNFTLKVSLVRADKDFPALAAHPIFRPVHGDGATFETGKLNADVVTSGAFRIAAIAPDGITLERAETYWNRKSIELERVRFVPTENAEKALAAYRAGEIDALTNAEFEPLALKLLAPYEDFRRTTYAAINFYEFNRNLPPFDDRRVREALAIAVERERISEDAMDGASEPAFDFLPFADDAAEKSKIKQDAARAKNLLAESGYPNGANFPVVKLLVNRNNLQQRIARSVAKMWKQNLNVESEIVVKGAEDFKAILASGDYSLARRGELLPTTDEAANLSMLFDEADEAKTEAIENQSPTADTISPQIGNQNRSAPVTTAAEQANGESENPIADAPNESEAITTEAQAIGELPAIPLYFPTAYSLVKPYVQGFELNALDAPSLKDVRINNNWQP